MAMSWPTASPSFRVRQGVKGCAGGRPGCLQQEADGRQGAQQRFPRQLAMNEGGQKNGR